MCAVITAIDRKEINLLKERGVPVKQIFSDPEHGIDATAQDMISVEEAGYETAIAPTQRRKLWKI